MTVPAHPLPGRPRAPSGSGLLLLAAGVLVGGLALPVPAPAQSWSTFQASRQVQAERELRVELDYGVGRFKLSPADTDHLYRVRLRFDEDAFRPIHEYANGTLRLGVEGEGRRLRRGTGEDELELRLSPSVPTELRMSFGAVRAEMDLGGINLRRLDLSTGASETSLRVSRPNPTELERARFEVGAASFHARELGNLNAREVEIEAGVGDVRLGFEGVRRVETRLKVSLGVGSLEIRVPRGVGIRLERSTFLTSMNAPDLTRRGAAYYSPEWEDAERRMHIEVGAAFGSVSILRIEPD